MHASRRLGPILFSARDCYQLADIFGILHPTVAAEYVHVSRRALRHDPAGVTEFLRSRGPAALVVDIASTGHSWYCLAEAQGIPVRLLALVRVDHHAYLQNVSQEQINASRHLDIRQPAAQFRVSRLQQRDRSAEYRAARLGDAPAQRPAICRCRVRRHRRASPGRGRHGRCRASLRPWRWCASRRAACARNCRPSPTAALLDQPAANHHPESASCAKSGRCCCDQTSAPTPLPPASSTACASWPTTYGSDKGDRINCAHDYVRIYQRILDHLPRGDPCGSPRSG
jgi:hypothetical protein